jgi:hypothetical protein
MPSKLNALPAALDDLNFRQPNFAGERRGAAPRFAARFASFLFEYFHTVAP